MTISRKKMAATASPATMPRVTLSDMEVSKEGACLRRGVLAHGCHGRRKAEAWKKLPGLEHDERTWTGAKGARGGTGVPQKTMGVVSPRGGWRMGIRAGQRLWCVAGDRAWNRRGREMREVGDARVGDRRSGCGRTGCLTKCQGVRSKSAYGDRSVRSERDQSKLLVVKKPCASASARTA